MRNNLLTKKDFVGAAKQLDITGWRQGEYGGESDGPEMCGAGALSTVALGNTYSLVASNFPEAVADALARGEGRSPEGGIINFNDQRDTTKEDVQTLLLFLGEIAKES